MHSNRDKEEMDSGGEIEGGGDENEFPSAVRGRKYSPVVAHDNDRAVLEMSSIDPRSSSSPYSKQDLKKVKVNMQSDVAPEGSMPNHSVNGPQRESKLELFGFDSLVNILGLKSMTGDQIQAPPSPRDGGDVSIALERPRPTAVKSGTLMGVFVPCLQNIMGIIYYIRFSWIVGMAGIGESLLLVAFCGSCTFLTTISLSAIATNGAMKGGGPYYLIGRALGPEVGVSIGLCFFLGNAVAGAMYVLGAVETFLDAVPAAGILRETVTRVNGTDIAEPITRPSLHDLQIYGIVVTILLCFIVFGGVKIINRVAPAFLVPVVFSLVCIFSGILLARNDRPAVKEKYLKDKKNMSNTLNIYVHLKLPNYSYREEKATAESVADAIADNRAGLVHLPWTGSILFVLVGKKYPELNVFQFWKDGGLLVLQLKE
ncbi:hypothetical protein MTR67_007482 [Solanum verrucosum]|uniref:Amino acid permease/ SLC12A domain-containing protein n=1 Tax=Solanum verrucosum TaxID=315347 RepID=A0AAF0PZW4_SOLVR|nr:hypothetical protein MTR67_007482 [Solanum verrucosum]